ncbi:MAG TPA: cytochrome c [Verrucomicrobiae bacterium]
MNPANPNPPANQGNQASKEPVAGFSGVPIWMVFLFGLLAYWSQLYLDGHAGGFSKDVYAPYTSFDEVAAANPHSAKDLQIAIGRDIFNKTCSACHQPNGLGKEGTAPPLVGSEWVLAPTAARIVNIPLNGLTGPISVKGKDWNLTMTPFRDNYNDEQIAAVLTFIRTRLGDNKAGPVSPDMVKAARAVPHTGPETSDELLKIPLQ